MSCLAYTNRHTPCYAHVINEHFHHVFSDYNTVLYVSVCTCGVFVFHVLEWKLKTIPGRKHLLYLVKSSSIVSQNFDTIFQREK